MIRMDLQFFGGRGSSSGGGTGGGASGGLDPSDIVSTTSLLSASGKRSEIDSVMSAVKNVFDDYGIDLSDIQIATLKGKGLTTMAYYDAGGNLAVNKNFFDSKKMDKAYDRCVESGFHPSRGNKSGLEAVASHELGHRLTEEVGRKMGLGDWQLDKASNSIVKDAKKKLGLKTTSDVRKKVSGYAKESNAEAVAEAFADVYCNGKKASKASQAIVDSLKKYL